MSHNVREQFQQSPAALAEFRDQNINRATARAQTELERQQNECDLAFNVYNSLAQRVEQTRIKVQELTPVFKTLQPVQVPLDDTKSGLIILIDGYIFRIVCISIMVVIYSVSSSVH